MSEAQWINLSMHLSALEAGDKRLKEKVTELELEVDLLMGDLRDRG